LLIRLPVNTARAAVSFIFGRRPAAAFNSSRTSWTCSETARRRPRGTERKQPLDLAVSVVWPEVEVPSVLDGLRLRDRGDWGVPADDPQRVGSRTRPGHRSRRPRRAPPTTTPEARRAENDLVAPGSRNGRTAASFVRAEEEHRNLARRPGREFGEGPRCANEHRPVIVASTPFQLGRAHPQSPDANLNFNPWMRH
jgi:hypothetical protein